MNLDWLSLLGLLIFVHASDIGCRCYCVESRLGLCLSSDCKKYTSSAIPELIVLYVLLVTWQGSCVSGFAFAVLESRENGDLVRNFSTRLLLLFD